MQPDKAITEQTLAMLIDRFYERIRLDPLIGPIFNDAIGDWPHHLEKLGHFWSSVMLSTGTYKGNPVAEHLKHIDRITPQMFERWLALWRETTTELMPPDAALALQAKATRIAESLQLAIRFRPGQPLPVPQPRAERSHKPYRSTPIFDQDSLPDALRREHRTKAGTWGAIHLLAGEIRLHFTDPPRTHHLTRDHPGVVAPEQPHWVEPIGPMRLRIDFHDGPPAV